jgi:hypothetical protein
MSQIVEKAKQVLPPISVRFNSICDEMLDDVSSEVAR